MAIVVEEEKREGVGILSIVTWLVVIGSIAGAVYFVFFKQPEIISNIAAPANFKNISELSRIKINPAEVVGNLDKSYRQYTGPIQSAGKYRANPFLGL